MLGQASKTDFILRNFQSDHHAKLRKRIITNDITSISFKMSEFQIQNNSLKMNVLATRDLHPPAPHPSHFAALTS